MSITTQKIIVGLLGFALFASVMTVGYVDEKRRTEERPKGDTNAIQDPQLKKGHEIFEKLSCQACHGSAGQGGIPNINAQTGEKVPPIAFVADSFTVDELREKILIGVSDVAPLEPDMTKPPLYMPGYKGLISDDELNLLVKYLNSLMPEDAQEEW